MFKVSKIVMAVFMMGLALAFISCSSESDPAIKVCKEFIKRAATGDKSLKEIIDFEAAMNKYGTTEKEFIEKAGAQKYEETKDDMVKTIMIAFAPLKNTYKSDFKDFKIEEKGVDFWIVSYLNPAKVRKSMKVKKINGTLKAYYFGA